MLYHFVAVIQVTLQSDMTRRALLSSRARRIITVQGKQRKKLTKLFKRFVSKKSNISGSMNSFGLVAIYPKLDVSRIRLVHARASGYSLVQSRIGTQIFEKVEKFEKC